MTELITNGTFDTDTTGWTDSTYADSSIVVGKLRVTNSASGAASAYQAISTTVGQTYRARADLIAGTAPAIALFVGNTPGSGAMVTATGAGSKNVTFTATATTTYISLANGSATTAGQYNEFDNVSVQPLPPRKPARSSSFLA